jgi:hypothetical protein
MQQDGCYACKPHGSSTNGSNTPWESSGHPSNLLHCLNTKFINIGTYGDYPPYTAYTWGTLAAGVARPPVGSACDPTHNSVNISDGYPPTFTPQNPSYPVYWHDYTNTTQLTCEYEETPLGTPVVLAWEPFDQSFTDIAAGVVFNLFRDPQFKQQVSWTKPNVQVAFLVLPNADGKVLTGAGEMFGNLTEQVPVHGTKKLGGIYPVSYKGNGFEALRMHDLNHDNKIDAADPVWARLRLWFNYSHDGIYDPVNKPQEIKTLDKMFITSINITFDDYRETNIRDRYGNLKKWVMKPGVTVSSGQAPELYDVVLLTH